MGSTVVSTGLVKLMKETIAWPELSDTYRSQRAWSMPPIERRRWLTTFASLIL